MAVYEVHTNYRLQSFYSILFLRTRLIFAVNKCFRNNSLNQIVTREMRYCVITNASRPNGTSAWLSAARMRSSLCVLYVNAYHTHDDDSAIQYNCHILVESIFSVSLHWFIHWKFSNFCISWRQIHIHFKSAQAAYSSSDFSDPLAWPKKFAYAFWANWKKKDCESSSLVLNEQKFNTRAVP